MLSCFPARCLGLKPISILRVRKRKNSEKMSNLWGPGQYPPSCGGTCTACEPMFTLCKHYRGQQDSQGSLNLFLPMVQHLQVIKAFPLLLLSSFYSSRGVYSKLF